MKTGDEINPSYALQSRVLARWTATPQVSLSQQVRNFDCKIPLVRGQPLIPRRPVRLKSQRGCFPLRESNPPPVPSQGRAIAGAIARESASLRTGRALTGAVRRIV